MAELEDSIIICPHGEEPKYYDECMCDGCCADRTSAMYLKGMKHKILSSFSAFLDTLDQQQLEAMVEKVK